MTQPSYDLTREPWIPCETMDGTRVWLGLEDVLLRAHELRAVHDESPLVTAVLHRVLLACLHRIVAGPTTKKAWAAAWNAPRFDVTATRGYFDKWRHRFDLFHPERPFLQVPKLFDDLRAATGKDPSTVPMRRLPLERSTYAGTVNLLEHGGDGDAATPSEAARAMLSVLGFGAGGRIKNTTESDSACPLRVGSVVLAVGATLRETLVLNLFVLGRERPVPSMADDRPAWERDEPTSYADRPCAGWLDALTWQARRLQLRVSAAGVVDAVVAGGESPVTPWSEPMFAMDARDEKSEPIAVKFMPDRAGFRDSVALYQRAAPVEGGRRPLVCSHLAELADEELLPPDFAVDLLLLGMSSDRADIRLTRAERVPLPMSLLMDADRLDALRAALSAAERVEFALGQAEYRLAFAALAMGDRKPDTKDVRALTDCLGARAYYWSALSSAFPAALREIASDDADAGRTKFVDAARRAAHRALAHAANQIGDGARAERARALGESRLHRALEEALPQTFSQSTQQGAP